MEAAAQAVISTLAQVGIMRIVLNQWLWRLT